MNREHAGECFNLLRLTLLIWQRKVDCAMTLRKKNILALSKLGLTLTYDNEKDTVILEYSSKEQSAIFSYVFNGY